MKRSIFAMMLAFALAFSANSFGQTHKTANKPKALPVAPGDLVHRSDFDPTIEYRSCDPKVVGSNRYLVWEYPGRSPLLPSELLKRAGLSGRNNQTLDRLVLGAPEDMPVDQRDAFELARQLFRGGVLKALHDENNESKTWENFMQLVGDKHYENPHSLGLRCGDTVGRMIYRGGTDSQGRPIILAREEYVVGFTPSVMAWSVGPMKTRDGRKMVNVILDCFNINPVPAEEEVPVEVVTAPPAILEQTAQVPVPTVVGVWVLKKHIKKNGEEIPFSEVKNWQQEQYSTEVMSGMSLNERSEVFIPNVRIGSPFSLREMKSASGFEPQNETIRFDPIVVEQDGRLTYHGVVLVQNPEDGSVRLPDAYINVKKGSVCGPAKIICWGIPLAAGTAIILATHHSGDHHKTPPDQVGKEPQPQAPRPFLAW